MSNELEVDTSSRKSAAPVAALQLAVKEFAAIAVAEYPMGGLHKSNTEMVPEFALVADAALTARTLY